MNEDVWKEYEDQDSSRFEVSNRDLAMYVIGEPDLEAQLLAITSLLCRNQLTDEALKAEIKQLDEDVRAYANGNAMYRMYLEDRWGDALHHSGFQDAAHSMAAVGMLAPFIESLFVSIFSGLRECEQSKINASIDDPRIAVPQDKFWDLRSEFYHRRRRCGVVAGILHVAHATGLTKYLPSGYDKVLKALFKYRNKMFHLGFEWPMPERIEFDKLRSRKWPAEWFRTATRGDEPWIFYMSDEFITHCLKTIDEVLEGVGAYFRERQGLT